MRAKAYIFTHLSILYRPHNFRRGENKWWSRGESHPGPACLFHARLSP